MKGREVSAAETARAVQVITSALLDRIGRGLISPGGKVPVLPMAVVTGRTGIDPGALRAALGQLVTSGAPRLEPGRGYCPRSAAVLAGEAEAGTR